MEASRGFPKNIKVEKEEIENQIKYLSDALFGNITIKKESLEMLNRSLESLKSVLDKLLNDSSQDLNNLEYISRDIKDNFQFTLSIIDDLNEIDNSISKIIDFEIPKIAIISSAETENKSSTAETTNKTQNNNDDEKNESKENNDEQVHNNSDEVEKNDSDVSSKVSSDTDINKKDFKDIEIENLKNVINDMQKWGSEVQEIIEKIFLKEIKNKSFSEHNRYIKNGVLPRIDERIISLRKTIQNKDDVYKTIAKSDELIDELKLLNSGDKTMLNGLINFVANAVQELEEAKKNIKIQIKQELEIAKKTILEQQQKNLATKVQIQQNNLQNNKQDNIFFGTKKIKREVKEF